MPASNIYFQNNPIVRDQEKPLADFIENRKGLMEQIDDILVIAIRM